MIPDDYYRDKIKTPERLSWLIEQKDYKAVKEYFKNINNMNEFLSEDCDEFNNNFELLNFINSGSCGIVFEGYSKKDPNKKVGLKFLMNKLLEEKREKKIKYQNFLLKTQKLNKELDLQKKFCHKNITKVYGFYGIKNCSCIAMEYAKYGDLEYFQRKLLQKKNLSETTLAYLTLQILQALNHCHQSKIIHMDIKPQNILLNENLNVKLTDFSVSQSYANYKDGTRITLPLAGTSLYMAPEVLNKIEIDVEECNKIDIFSLGILLYDLAFGLFPFQLEYSDKKNFKDIYNKIMTQNLIFPKSRGYSNLFKNFISGLLNKNIKQRLSINEAFEDPWIKGAKLIYEEKEKIGELEKFLIMIVTDNLRCFNDYVRNYKTDTISMTSSTNSFS